MHGWVPGGRAIVRSMRRSRFLSFNYYRDRSGTFVNKSLATQRNFDRAERPRASMAPALRTLLALFVVCSGGCSFASLQSGVDADDAGLDTALVRGAAISAARVHIPPVVHLLRTPLLAAALILCSFSRGRAARRLHFTSSRSIPPPQENQRLLTKQYSAFPYPAREKGDVHRINSCDLARM